MFSVDRQDLFLPQLVHILVIMPIISLSESDRDPSTIVVSILLARSKKTQPAQSWTAADICTNCVYTIPSPRDGVPDSVYWGKAGRRSLPPGWLCSSQKRGTSSQILARRHTQTDQLQSFGCVTSVTNNIQVTNPNQM